MANRRKARREARKQASTGAHGADGGMSKKQMKNAMGQMNVQEIKGVEEVIIRMKDEDLILVDPEVQTMTPERDTTYLIQPKSIISKPRTPSEDSLSNLEEEIKLKEADIEIVMNQTKTNKETATQALKDANGDLTSAIIQLMNK